LDIYVGHLPLSLTNLIWPNTVATVYYSTIVANTAISTLLIIWRAFFLGGKRGVSRYRRVLCAFVESAAVYSVVLIVYLPFVASDSPKSIKPSIIGLSILIPITVSGQYKSSDLWFGSNQKNRV
jgi:hypothetical protein